MRKGETEMEMEMEMEMEGVLLEKIWDLHDKLSDAIHSISRTHFKQSSQSQSQSQSMGNGILHYSESKSLNSIRSALEILEDRLHFFHTVQIQQRAERDAALAHLEQSRILLALKLAEHSGKRYKVIDEAMDFVGDVRNSSCFFAPELLSDLNPHASSTFEHLMQQRGHNPNVLVRVLLSGWGSAKRTLQLDRMGGFLGNVALFAFSVVALLHLQQVTFRGDDMFEMGLKQGRIASKLSETDCSSSREQLSRLDVRLARG